MARSALVKFAAIVLLGVGCAPEKKVQFDIMVINTREEELRCVIYRQEELLRRPDSTPILTPTKLTLDFAPSTDGSPESLRLRVRAVDVDPAGNTVIRGLLAGEVSEYREDSRDVRPTDSRRQVFILPRRPAGG